MQTYKSINKNVLSAMLIAMTLFFSACSEDSGGTYPPSSDANITISGTVVDHDTNVSIEAAQVTVVNIQTQENALDPFYTLIDGKYSFDLPTGTYEVRVQAQGYEASPPAGVIGIPIAETTTFDVGLDALFGSFGSLKIDLVDYTNSVGALVILKGQSSLEEYIAISSIGGALMMYNLPVEDYNISIKTVGHTTYTSDNNVSITAETESVVDYINLEAIPGVTVSGVVSFQAIENGDVDVSLTDPETGVAIPGTNVLTSAGNYSMVSIAPGTYIIRATYSIDGYVVDPDNIIKLGEPKVTVAGVAIEADTIVVTGAVALTSPIAEANGIAVEVNTTLPTFNWVDYSSTSDYVVEVVNASGDVIWGGFEENLTKKVVVDSSLTTIEYNDDGQATEELVNGKYYRWKIYASKDVSVTQDPLGWKLISSSEEAQGVFKVVLP